MTTQKEIDVYETVILEILQQCKKETDIIAWCQKYMPWSHIDVIKLLWIPLFAKTGLQIKNYDEAYLQKHFDQKSQFMKLKTAGLIKKEDEIFYKGFHDVDFQNPSILIPAIQESS